MNAQILIDAIVRQTMILIAQLSTADGNRSGLSHVADEVFMGLVRELESQGLGKKVIADMFGLALRSYQQKVQRLSESATKRGETLWGAVHTFLSEVSTATRDEVLEHFRHDEEQKVRSILNDLVESGLAHRSGRGNDTRYRVATEEELADLGVSAAPGTEDADAALVWIHVYRGGPISRDQLSEAVALPAEALDAAIEGLLADERITAVQQRGGTFYTAERCLIPLGEAAGWEAAVIDHHRAVLNALAAKVVSGRHVSAAKDEVGGTTLSFNLYRGHPKEAEVRRLLASVREQVLPLWEEAAEHNRIHRVEPEYKVTFYCGQYLVDEDDET